MFFGSNKFFYAFGMLVLSMVLGSQGAHGQSANWINWNAPHGYDRTAVGERSVYQYTDSITGSVTDRNGNTIGVTLQGEVTDRSCFESNIADCDGYWKYEGGWSVFPEGTFTNSVVTSLPPTQQLVSQVGDGERFQMLTFSGPVSGLVMNVYSLGITYKSEYTFDRDFVILSQDPRCDPDAFLQYCLVKDGLTLRGFEGNGTIMFEGDIQTLSWEITAPEDFSGFNFALTGDSTPPPPPALPCDLVGVRTLNQGQWSSNARFSPLSNHWFNHIFPHGLVIGGGHRSATFTNSGAIKAFLPQGGQSMILLSAWVNPTQRQLKNSIAGELVAAKLNVGLNPGIVGAVLIKGKRLPFEGVPVADIIREADAAISWTGDGHSPMPTATRLSQLDKALKLINQSFLAGHNKRILECPCEEEHIAPAESGLESDRR
jgi:hypothetical protein